MRHTFHFPNSKLPGHPFSPLKNYSEQCKQGRQGDEAAHKMEIVSVCVGVCVCVPRITNMRDNVSQRSLNCFSRIPFVYRAFFIHAALLFSQCTLPRSSLTLSFILHSRAFGFFLLVVFNKIKRAQRKTTTKHSHTYHFFETGLNQSRICRYKNINNYIRKVAVTLWHVHRHTYTKSMHNIFRVECLSKNSFNAYSCEPWKKNTPA